MIDFPTSPAQGTTITAAGGITWEWNGTKWMMKNAGTDEVFIGPTDPGPVGDLWFNTTTDILYALDAGVWVAVSKPTGTVGYVELTSSITSITVQTTILSMTVTVVAGRRYKLSGYAALSNPAGGSSTLYGWPAVASFSGTGGATNIINSDPVTLACGTTGFPSKPQHVFTASASGSQTHNLTVAPLGTVWGAQTMSVLAFPTKPAFLLLEDITYSS